METLSDYLLTFLLNATWQIPLVVALAALASFLLRNSPARYLHLIWVAALLGAIIIPIYSTMRRAVTASVPVAVPAVVAPPDGLESTSAASPTTSAAPGTLPEVSFSAKAGVIVTVIYCLVLLCSCVRFARAWSKTLAISAATEDSIHPPPLARVWKVCTEAFAIKGVRLLRSGAVPSPVALGALRPAVILPHHLWHETSEELLTAAVGHELAHIARHDFLANLFHGLLFPFISFHPGTWYIRRQLERTREMACDEAVSTLLLKPQAYARSILQIATTITHMTSPGYTVGIFDGGMLEDRMRRVLQKSASNLRRARLFFAVALSCLVLAGVLASGLALTARGQSAFQTHLKQGVSAYNTGDFRTASSHFSTVVLMEPDNVSAKLYLANSLMSEFYAQSQPDLRLRASAIQQYTDVLAKDPSNKQALAGMTALTMEGRQLRDAQQWATKLAEVDANDKTAWYTLGVLNWMIVYPEYQRARQAAGGVPENYAILDSNIRRTFRNEYLPLVEQGMQMLRKGLALDPKYDAAMAYMNLLYRIKAAMVDSPAEAAGYIAEADKWVNQALELRRGIKAPAPPENATLDLDGPPPGPPRRATMVKAPPPPPPSRDQSQQIASALPKPTPQPNQPPLIAEYWQVVAVTDMPAIDLYRRLRGKGFEAVLHAGSDQLTRVLAGPYFDEASARKARTALEAAGFRVLRKWE